MSNSLNISPSIAQTRLERAVVKWANAHRDMSEPASDGLKDVCNHGCQSGIVGDLIYYTDTVKFFARHRRDISELLKEAIENTGLQPADLFGDKWDKEDPLAQEDLNRNLLAWFGFEESAGIILSRLDIEL